MNRMLYFAHALTVCALLCATALDSVASNPDGEMTAKPLLPVTPETLSALCSSTRVEEFDYQPRVIETGGVVPVSDGMSTQGSAIRALQAAFRVPVCVEWAIRNRPPVGHDDTPRFPFAVEANERLVDALDKLKRNSSGFLQWALLHERIVVSAQPATKDGDTGIADRVITVVIEADTFEEALEQIEAAYNRQYSDIAFVVSPDSPRLMFKGPAAVAGRAGKFLLKEEAPLREIVLAVLDQMQDPAICYSLSERYHLKNQRYFGLDVTKRDAPELNTFVDGEEARQFDSLLQSSTQRLAEYLDRAEKAAKSAGETLTGETKP